MANTIDILVNTVTKTGGLTDLKSGLDMAQKALQQVEAAYKATVGAVMEYTDEIESLNTITNTGTAATIQLVEAADDARVSFDTVRVASKTLNENGIQPTIENLAALADEYVAIQDPVAKTSFLIEKFGSRAGPEMGKLLAQGGKALLANADSTREFAESIANADEELATWKAVVDDAGDAAGRFNMQIGAEVVKKLLELKEGLEKLAAGYILLKNAIDNMGKTDQQRAQEKLDADLKLRKSSHDYFNSVKKDFMGYDTGLIAIIETEESAKKAAEERAAAEKQAAEDVSIAVSGPLQDAYTDYMQSIDDAREKERLLQEEIDKAIKQGYSPLGSKVVELKEQMGELRGEETEAIAAFQAATKEMIYQKAAAGLDADAALELGRAMGLVSESDYNLATALSKLKEKYKETGDLEGYIEAVKILNQSAQDGYVSLDEVKKAMDALDGRVSSATVVISTVGGVGGEGGSEGGSGSQHNKEGERVVPKKQKGRETAESAIPGMGGASGGGNVTINVYGEQGAKVIRAIIAEKRITQVNDFMGTR